MSPTGPAHTAQGPDRSAPEPAARDTAILTIDLAALAANYHKVRDLAAPAECAAVVKADAYGLGMAKAAPALWRAGCRTFFVATLGEAQDLRALLPEAVVYVLNGLLPETAEAFRDLDLRPILNSAAELREWAQYCASVGEALPCAVHIDTGMNRLGFSVPDVQAIANAADLFEAVSLCLVMSHLACADDADHPKNPHQRAAFDDLRALFPEAIASLANSAGILLGPDYIYDLVRPGLALYGGHPRRRGANPFRTVVHLKGRILQVRDAQPGETVGYGATRTVARPTRIAVVAAGYADGVFRALSTGDGEDGLVVYVGSHVAPIMGRISMDLLAVDVTDVPHAVSQRGQWVELLGPNVEAHDVAHHAGTIDYEILTSLGRRAFRRYIG